MLLFAKLIFVRPDIDAGALLPFIVLGALMVITLCFEFKPTEKGGGPEEGAPTSSRPMAMLFSALGLLALIVSYLFTDNTGATTTFNGMLASDPFSRGAGLLIACCALLAILAGQEELVRHGNRHGGEFIALILGSSIGMLLMSSALNTMVMFLGLELFSIALYLLCIFFPERASSREAGMKYFLLSSAASAIMLYGMALLYGASGTTWINEMNLNPQALEGPLATAGSVLVLCGLLFKLAAVPFHFWAPDVYEGAPTSVTAFMSVATKVAAIVALWRIFVLGCPELGQSVQFIIISISLVSMLLGNLFALAQPSVKRMLAYSGVGNAGYLLIAPAYGPGMETPMLFFLASYLVANIGAFLSLAVVEGLLGREVNRTDLRGLYRSHPVLASVFALSLVSLAGLPPAGGFLAKFYLFGTAVSSPVFYLPAIGIICSILGAAYYLGTAITMFDGRGDSEVATVLPLATVVEGDESSNFEPATSLTAVALALCAAGIVVLGIVPGPFMAWLGGAPL